MEYRYYVYECIACVLVTRFTCYMLVSNIRRTFCVSEYLLLFRLIWLILTLGFISYSVASSTIFLIKCSQKLLNTKIQVQQANSIKVRQLQSYQLYS